MKKNKKVNYDYLNKLNVPMNQEIPTFVSWNWPLIRKVSFFVFLSSIFAACAAVVAMMYNLPKQCNPEVPWYKGSVFYEIFPASFKDSNGDGLGDLRGLASQVDYLQNLSIGAVRLNSIFPSTQYPEKYHDVTSLMKIDAVLGDIDDLVKLIALLHERNISLILDLPLSLFDKLSPSTMENMTMPAKNISDESQVEEFRRIERDIIDDNTITNVMRFWLSKGVDGFYMKGLENFSDDQYLMENVREWKYVLGEDRVLIVNQSLIEDVKDNVADEILQCIDLVDVFLPISNGTQSIANQINDLMKSKLRPTEKGAWIHWSLNGVDQRRVSTGISPNASLTGLLMLLMLPGTPSIFYGDEISMEESHDPLNEHEETKHLHHLPAMNWRDEDTQFTNRNTLPWLPKTAAVQYQQLEYIIEAIRLRKRTPSLYKNIIIKDGVGELLNLQIRANKNDLLMIERSYPRRSTFISITNLGDKRLSLDLSALYYSGELVLGPAKKNKVFFTDFELRTLETVIVKLDK